MRLLTICLSGGSVANTSNFSAIKTNSEDGSVGGSLGSIYPYSFGRYLKSILSRLLQVNPFQPGLPSSLDSFRSSGMSLDLLPRAFCKAVGRNRCCAALCPACDDLTSDSVLVTQDGQSSNIGSKDFACA